MGPYFAPLPSSASEAWTLLGGRVVMPVVSRRSVILAGTGLLASSAIGAKAQSNPPKRIYIVQSYEKGHVCGEPQAEGILGALAAAGWQVGQNLTVRSYYMDT